MASQLRRALLPTGTIATSLYLLSTPVFAEETEEVPKKKSIYDAPPRLLTPPPTVPATPTPTDRIAASIGCARRFVNAHHRLLVSHLDEAFSKYLHYEHSVTSTIAALAPPKDSPEKVLPGVLYVAVAAMASGIVVRKRMFPVRALTPVLVAVGAGWAVVPELTRNVGGLVWEGEKLVPGVAEAHLAVREQAEGTYKQVEGSVKEAQGWVDEKRKVVKEVVESLVKKG